MSKKLQETKQEVKPQIEQIDLNDLPLKTIEDYRAYNKEARRQKRPIRIPPSELHKQVKIKFQRFDQPENVLKFYVRNADIDYQGQFKPGGIYTVPYPVMKFLNSLAVPVYGEVPVKDGGTTVMETKQIDERPRFSCQVVEL